MEETNLFRVQQENERALRDPALSLLLKDDADWYSAVLSAAFDGLPERITRQTLLERIDGLCLEMIAQSAMPRRYVPRRWSSEGHAELADALYKDLLTPPRAGYGYGWIREDVDPRTRESIVSRTSGAYRAQELLRGIASNRREMTSSKLKDVRGCCSELADLVSVSRAERVASLRRAEEAAREERERLEAGAELEKASHLEVHEKLELIDELLEHMPAAGHRIAERERATARDLARELRKLSLSSSELIEGYVEQTVRTFERSDDGRSFRQAEGVLKNEFFEEELGRTIETVRASMYADAETLRLCRAIAQRFSEMKRALRDVAGAIRESSDVACRLARRSCGSRARAQLDLAERLSGAFARWARDTKGRNESSPVEMALAHRPRALACVPAPTDPDSPPRALREVPELMGEGADAMTTPPRLP